MSITELQLKVQQLEAQVASLRNRIGTQPVRRAAGGGGTLPDATEEGQVLMVVDDVGNVDWDWPRIW